MKLSKYIQEHHNGNISEFARSEGVRQNQVHRWLNRDCEVLNGEVWCKVTKQVKSND